MLINKAYKFRIYPNQEQEQCFAHHFGCVRFVYNRMLALFKETRQFNKNQYKVMLPDLKRQFAWLKYPNSQSLQSAVDNLASAIARWGKGLGGFPVFKTKHLKNSFEVPQNWFVDEAGKLHIPKLASGIKVVWHRPVGQHDKQCYPYKVNYIVISRSPSGKYWVSFSCVVNVPDPVIDPALDRVGVDSGLKDLVVGVNQKGFVKYQVTAPRYFRKAEARISRLQQVLAAKQKGSNNWQKVKKKLAIAYERVAFKRADLAHKISYQLTQENQLVGLETLNIQGMLRNHCLAKSVSDAAIRALHVYTTYKGKWYGAAVQFIERWFPSTKLCWDCGSLNDNLTLSDREWRCPSCGRQHVRDVTAAWNILQEAVRLLPGNPELSP
ncbi:transposase [Synechococcus sp. PCC 6716]|nr:transposase [Synechococcus sp. PCC 6716]